MTLGFRAGTTTAAAAAVTPLAPAVPTGLVSGDLSLLVVEIKQATAGTTPAVTGGTTGWTQIGSTVNTGTNLTAGTDTGTNYLWLYYRTDTYSAPSITTSGANSAGAAINAYTKDAGNTWDVTQYTTGVDATLGANGSITGAANINVDAGDWIFVPSALGGDAGSITGGTIAAPSATFSGTFGLRTNLGVTTGADSRLVIIDWPVLTGPSTGAPTYTWTNTSSLTGVAGFLRIREAAPAGGTAPVPARVRVSNPALSRASNW